jgi:two-component system, NarL family, sensor histidine kinase UhpB
VASSLDLKISDERFEFALLAMTVILVLLLNILMLQRRFSPLDELIRDIEAINPSDPAAFKAPEEPVEEVGRLAHAFAKLLERIEAERRRAGRLQLRAQEEERKRVARDLHDEVNQALTAILLRLEALTQIAPPRLREELSETKTLANQAMGELLQLARQLRPTALDDHGLIVALATQVEDFGRRTGVRAAFRRHGPVPPLTDEEQLVIYRVTQESLSNIAQHAEATSVNVELSFIGKTLLKVVDNGRGFYLNGGPPRGEYGPSARLGLSGMRERALLAGGSLRIDSMPGEGTSIELTMGVP